jgi:tRNA A37 threonylcarbamoyladenosine dehydratase
MHRRKQLEEIKPVTRNCSWIVRRIVIVGCGGIGSHLWDMLAREMYNRREHTYTTDILLIDADVVEEKNLGRQSFGVADIGLPKAEALARRYKKHLEDNGISVKAERSWLSTDTELLKQDDVVLLCVDNNKTRKMLNDYILDFYGNICAINGGNRDHLVTTHIMLKSNYKVVTAPFEHSTTA